MLGGENEMLMRGVWRGERDVDEGCLEGRCEKDRLRLNKCIVFLFNGDQILSSPDERH